jgi:hypothetical protein
VKITTKLLTVLLGALFTTLALGQTPAAYADDPGDGGSDCERHSQVDPSQCADVPTLPTQPGLPSLEHHPQCGQLPQAPCNQPSIPEHGDEGDLNQPAQTCAGRRYGNGSVRIRCADHPVSTPALTRTLGRGGDRLYAEFNNGAAFLLAPCRQEDSKHCFWDARRRGNGFGTSFVSLYGKILRY